MLLGICFFHSHNFHYVFDSLNDRDVPCEKIMSHVIHSSITLRTEFRVIKSKKVGIFKDALLAPSGEEALLSQLQVKNVKRGGERKLSSYFRR